MNVKITQESKVTRPVPERLRSTVLDHATVVDLPSFGLRNNEGLWPSYNCLDTFVPTQMCPDPLSTTEKTFQSAPWIPAYDFAVYGGVECNAVGLDRQDMAAEVERVFLLNEGRGVEQSLLLNRFVALTPGSDDPNISWPAPVDVSAPNTVTGITALPIALALLEGYAAAHYAGVPTIHMPRAAASMLNERIVWQGDKAYTRSGSKVALGGGYDAGQSETDGTWDLYATGEVYVERSDMVSVSNIVIPGSVDTSSGGSLLTDNMVLALAERMYRVGVDCFVAKATAKVW